MEQPIGPITPGAADESHARTLTELLGWQGQQIEETVFFQAGGTFPRISSTTQHIGLAHADRQPVQRG